MAHNKERLSHKSPVTRVKIGRGVIGDLPSIGFHLTPTKSKDFRPGKSLDISSTLTALRQTAKLRPGKRNSRNS